MTDGPFVDAKKHIAGFYIIDADDLDAALAWADKVVNASVVLLGPPFPGYRPGGRPDAGCLKAPFAASLVRLAEGVGKCGPGEVGAFDADGELADTLERLEVAKDSPGRAGSIGLSPSSIAIIILNFDAISSPLNGLALDGVGHHRS